MPLWAILYSFVLFISALFTIKISPYKSPIYQLSELASGIFAVTFFLFYYEVIPYPKSILTPFLMLAFILFQEIWINRELYAILSLEDIPEKERGWMLFFIPFTTILFLSPFIWIVTQVFKHYFLFA
jgi:hypothetical protein